jgi:hypothetical protein
MSITTFKGLYVDELYLEGKLFTPENFRGEAGDPYTNPLGTKGPNGKDWSTRWDSDIIKSPAASTVGIYKLPDPGADDLRFPKPITDPPAATVEYFKYQYTMLRLSAEDSWQTGANVGVTNHKNEFMGRFWDKTQDMIFILVDNVWILS